GASAVQPDAHGADARRLATPARQASPDASPQPGLRRRAPPARQDGAPQGARSLPERTPRTRDPRAVLHARARARRAGARQPVRGWPDALSTPVVRSGRDRAPTLPPATRIQAPA